MYNDDFEERMIARDAEDIAELQQAKAVGHAKGKEELTWEKLEKLYKPRGSGILSKLDYFEAEETYYLGYPDMMTLKELADKMREIDSWR